MQKKECIICREIKNENLFSEEHIIPDSLGGTIKISEVCKKCNEEMGKKLDYHLTDFISNRIYRKKEGALCQLCRKICRKRGSFKSTWNRCEGLFFK